MELNKVYNYRKNSFLVSYKLADQHFENIKSNLFVKLTSKIIPIKYIRILEKKNFFRLAFPTVQTFLKQEFSLQSLSTYPEKSESKMELANLGYYLKFKDFLLFAKSILQTTLEFFFILNILFKKKSLITNNLGIEIAQGVNSNFKRSELNWVSDTFNYYENLILILTEPTLDSIADSKDDSEIIRNFIKRGSTVYTNRRKLIGLEGIRFCNFPVSDARIFPNHLFWLIPKYYCWISTYLFWRIFFHKNNIKTWFFSNEEGAANIIQVAAIDSLNGVSLTRHRSNLGEAWGYGYQSSHILLTWAEEGITHFKIRNNANDCFVIAGNPFVHKIEFTKWREKAKEISQSFNSDNLFVISFFDNIFGPNQEVDTNTFSELLNMLLKIIENNPHVRCIYKTKKQPVFPNETIKVKIKNLEKQNKLVLLSYNYLPGVIAFASNIVIGIGASSPALEASIIGVKSYIFWPSPDLNHPLLCEKNIIMTNVNDLENELNHILKMNENYNFKLKNFNKIDYYSDGMGPHRLEQIFNITIGTQWNNRIQLYKSLEKNNLFLKYKEQF